MKTLPEDFQKFIKAVDKAYNKNDEDRLMLERAFDLSSRDLRQVNDELRKSEEKFRMLADSSSFAILMHQGDRWIYANRAAMAISGYTEEELFSMHFWDVVHPDYRDLIKKRGLDRQQGKGDAACLRIQSHCKNRRGKMGQFDRKPHAI